MYQLDIQELEHPCKTVAYGGAMKQAAVVMKREPEASEIVDLYVETIVANPRLPCETSHPEIAHYRDTDVEAVGGDARCYAVLVHRVIYS